MPLYIHLLYISPLHRVLYTYWQVLLRSSYNFDIHIANLHRERNTYRSCLELLYDNRLRCIYPRHVLSIGQTDTERPWNIHLYCIVFLRRVTYIC